ncbi:MAG: hypothetical protein M3501_03240 [Actinomycetota bacterium]|jgi:hypothetical protein|nr:hypothetical protein [Acidimicrobiia bacterium]MBA3801655.1 hypothetical protein [Acidimicrobiia bacterium]MDQ3176637.1 hypothetical protein [Actinomycetota bacterium]MDQ3310796.1 hypothetical protein [Actinomycetota bacterium]MDQ3350963.1 hypothetical protein [Actinomycetota bacterium]
MASEGAGKRQRERDRLDKAKRKQLRKVERLAAAADRDADVTPSSQEEVVAELADLHSRFAEGTVSPEDFESEKADLARRLQVD